MLTYYRKTGDRIVFVVGGHRIVVTILKTGRVVRVGLEADDETQIFLIAPEERGT